MKKLFALLVLCLAVPLAAQAEAPNRLYSSPDLSQKKYYQCQVNSDCMPAQLPCGRVAVVSRLYFEEVQGWYDFAGHRYKCLEAAPKQEAKNVECRQNTCIADIQQVSTKLPDRPETRNPQYCETTEDCAYVNGPCGAKIVINKIYKDGLQKDYDRLRAAGKENCFWPDRRTVRKFTCEKNTCGAVLDIPDEADWHRPTDMTKPGTK
ncbi:MAG TPA: hypothetical protein VEF76_04270 [Patescibacteria group bacterium]|nr:hypothetical protein [Patescibacteria group bacterium]